MLIRFAALKLIAVAILLAGPATNAVAIGFRKTFGNVVETGYLSGTVTHVDPKRHIFTLTWQGKGYHKMEQYFPSFQDDYEVTDNTVYKNGSWASIQKGARVRISGHSFVVSLVEILGQHRTLNAEIFSH